jgi:WD40 repeat protein
VGLADGTVRCEGLATTAIKLHNAPVQHVRLMANDQKLLIIYADHTLVLWDVVNGQEIAMTTVPCDPEKAILSVAFSDQLIATGGADGRTHIFDANDLSFQAKLEAESTTKPMVGSDDQRYWQPITAMAFTPDGSHLLCGLQMDSYLLNRDLATGTLITEDNSFVDMLGVYVGDATDPGGIQSIVYSPDQFHLLIASGYAVCIVDADTLELKERRSRHHEDVQHITVSPDGIYFVTAARSEILYWAMDRPEPLGTIPLTKSLKEMKFSADGQQLYGLSQRGQVLVWEMSPDAWTNQARSKATRELTDNERNRYLDRETDTDYFPD